MIRFEMLAGGTALLRALLESLQEGVLLVRADGTLEVWNPAALRLLGIESDPAEWYARIDADSELARAFARAQDTLPVQLGDRRLTITTRTIVNDDVQPPGRLHVVTAQADPRPSPADPHRAVHDIKNALYELEGSLDAVVSTEETSDALARARATCDRLRELSAKLGSKRVPRSTSAHPPSQDVAAPARRGKVCVIDDNAQALAAMGRALRQRHDVTCYERPQEALLAVARGTRFDVILCDILMPSKSGIDFYHELALIAPDQASRIVFVSGARTPEVLAFFEEVPNPRYEKPLASDTLREIVDQHVREAEPCDRPPHT